VWLKFNYTLLAVKVEIYPQAAISISPNCDMFLINCSRLLDDSRTIINYEISLYAIIHLHIRLGGEGYDSQDATNLFDHDDIKTFDDGLLYSKSASILINANIRSYRWAAKSIPWNISKLDELVKEDSLQFMIIADKSINFATMIYS